MAAMAAHNSQIGPEYLDPLDFAGAYGREWFVRRGEPGVLDRLSATPTVSRPRPPVTARPPAPLHEPVLSAG
jgi:hypothetical protein